MKKEKDNVSSRKFTVRITKDPTGGFSGKCLELPSAISEGETIDELKSNMKEAIELVLESIEKECPPEETVTVEIPA